MPDSNFMPVFALACPACHKKAEYPIEDYAVGAKIWVLGCQSSYIPHEDEVLRKDHMLRTGTGGWYPCHVTRIATHEDYLLACKILGEDYFA